MQTFVSIDIGTTNWKVILFDPNGTPLQSEKRATTMYTAADGLSYYDPAAIWDAVCQMTKALFASHKAGDVAGVCVTSMGESVVPLGAEGEVLSGIIPWFDTRSHAQARQVMDAVGDERVFDITGTRAGPIFSLPKLLWVQKHNAPLFAKARKWLQMTDYVNYRLCGEMATDHSMACRTLAYDLSTCQWSQEMLGPFGFNASLFPAILPAGHVLGHISKGAALETGLVQGTPLVMGGHDHPVGCIGGNVFGGDTVFNSSGTAEPYLYVSEKGAPLPTQRLGQRLTRHPDPSRLITWGGIVASGITVDWAVRTLAPGFAGSYDELFEAGAPLAPGSDGLLFHPHLRGSGAPWWDAACRGSFLGLTSQHTPTHMLRSLLEGLCFQSRMILDMHEALQAGRHIQTIRCMGGGSRIRLWQSIKASVTGCVVEANSRTEATPLGAAMLAAAGLGLYASMEEAAQTMSHPCTAYYPDPEAQKAYQPLVSLYQQSYLALESINHQLTTLQQ